MSKTPETTFRLGNVSASVFVNEANGDGGRPRKFRSVNVQRSYRDGDQTKFVSSLGVSAQRYVNRRENRSIRKL